MIKVNMISATTLSSTAISPEPELVRASTLGKNDSLTITDSNQNSTIKEGLRNSNYRTATAITVREQTKRSKLEAEQSLTEKTEVVNTKSVISSNQSLKNDKKSGSGMKDTSKGYLANENFSLDHVNTKKMMDMKQSAKIIRGDKGPSMSKNLKASLKHQTSVVLQVLPHGDDKVYKLKGKLWDTTANVPLQGKEIFFTGSSSINIANQETNEAGVFEAVLVPLATKSLYKIQAHFAENSHFYGATSNTLILKITDKKLASKSLLPNGHDFRVPDTRMVNSSSIIR